MEELIRQIEVALANRLYYVALFPALTLPDICGAIDSSNGRASGVKYAAWFDKYVAPKYMAMFIDPDTRATETRPTMTGDVCYRYRCSLLHQGRSDHAQTPFDRVIFVPPASVTGWDMHNNRFRNQLQIDVERFCRDIAEGVQAWLGDVKGSQTFETNYSAFIRYYPEGVEGLTGFPVYA
jgi:hypothetical protein